MKIWFRRVLLVNFGILGLNEINGNHLIYLNHRFMAVFVHVINQTLNMSPYSVPLLGNVIFIGNNMPLRALRTVFTRKSDSLKSNIPCKAVEKW